MSTFNDPVTEQDLPGIGRRYQMTDDSGLVVTVIVHHSGRRDVYLPSRGSGDVVAVSFTDDQARQLGALLAGVYLKPAVVARVEAVIGGLLIDWVTLDQGSPAVGRSIADLEIRRHTRMTVAAIVRDEASLVAPDPTTVLADGDRLVVIGRPEDLPTFLRVVVT